MKTDNLIKKSAKMPGVSLSRTDNSITLILKTSEGNGSITFFPLFSSLMLAYISVSSPVWPAPCLYPSDLHGTETEKSGKENISDGISGRKGPLLLNYCVSGRCEIPLNTGSYVYVKDGDLSLTERSAQGHYVYPGRNYQGLEFFIDTDSSELSRCSWIEEEFGIDFRRLVGLYCSDGGTYISGTSPEAEAVLHKLWELRNAPLPHALYQMKLYSLSLFSLLLNPQAPPSSRVCTFFTEAQVTIAKRTEKIITADLSDHHPARELSDRFGISATSLKNYFRAVYGNNLSVYLKKLRMKKAADLLVSTTQSVSEVAEQVGYLNQSKFAAVFKKHFGRSPLEYRKAGRLYLL